MLSIRILFVALVAFVVACGAKKDASGDPPSVPSAPSEAKSVAKDAPTLNAKATEVDACMRCRKEHCSNYQGAFDLVKGCFETEDKAFAAECQAAAQCARKHKCGYGPLGSAVCFCGTEDLAACQTEGVASGPCRKEFFAAARTSDLKELASRFADVKYPSGVAHYLIECERDMCPACRQN